MWQLLAKFQIILLHNGEDKINGKCEVKNFAARKYLNNDCIGETCNETLDMNGPISTA